MFGRMMTLFVLLAAIVLGVLFQSTSPVETGPVGILAVFFCLYIVFMGIASLLVRVGSWLVVYIVPLHGHYRSVVSVERSYYFGSVLAFAPTILLAINSVGSLGVYEYLLVILLVGTGLFYIKKRE
jgi:hypothetical protein